MKLFTLRTAEGTTDFYFSNKAEAKAKRNELNGGTPAELKKAEKPVKYFVTYGPEHRVYG